MATDGPPDSGRGRLRKRVRPPSVDETIDELTPVEHLIEQVGAVKQEVAAVQAVVTDHAATLSERYEMPSSEAWQRMSRRMDDLADRLKVCETEREVRNRWAKWIRALLGMLGAGATSALAWVVVKIGDAGEERQAEKQRAAQIQTMADAIRALDARLTEITTSQAVDHARLDDLRRPGP